jgi:hypothetical protein
MRNSLFLVAIIATFGLAAGASAQEPIPQGEPITDYSTGAGGGCCNTGCGHGVRLHRHGCGRLGHGCGAGGCGHQGHRTGYDGLDRSFNCGCTGSYKFPVPPQYTYFWPGSLYSLDLMTSYHSPWRFPPLKPYTEEVLLPAGAENVVEDGLQPASAYEVEAAPVLRPGEVESMSSAMQRYFR